MKYTEIDWAERRSFLRSEVRDLAERLQVVSSEQGEYGMSLELRSVYEALEPLVLEALVLDVRARETQRTTH